MIYKLVRVGTGYVHTYSQLEVWLTKVIKLYEVVTSQAYYIYRLKKLFVSHFLSIVQSENSLDNVFNVSLVLE